MSLLTGAQADRRKWQRISVSEGDIFLQWEADEKLIGVNTVLIDISHGGAMVMSPVPISIAQQVQVAFRAETPRSWMAATVVGLVQGRRWNQVRLEFHVPCSETALRDTLTRCMSQDT